MRKLFSILAVAALAVPATAQIPRAVDTSDIRFDVQSDGLVGIDGEHSLPGFVVPRNSSTSYLFGAGIWFGAKKRVGADLKKLAFITFDPVTKTSWASRPYSGEEEDFAFFRSLYYHPDGTWEPITTPATQNWPLWVRPGMRVTPLTPGEYVLEDYHRNTDSGYAAAAFMPGVYAQIVMRYSDKDVVSQGLIDSSEMAGYPLGLEFRHDIYWWATGRYKHTVVMQYEVINKSNDTLVDCVVGQTSNPDLGDPKNDHVSFYKEHPELRSAFARTDPEADPYQTLLLSVIEAPQADASGRVDNRNRLNYHLAGRIASAPAWSAGSDPMNSDARYDLMRSGTFADQAGPGDERVLMASDPFTMYPGDTAHFAVLYAVTPSAAGNDVDTLVRSIFADYYGPNGFNSTASAPARTAIVEGASLAVPNPARDYATFTFTLAHRADVRVRLVNALGESVWMNDEGALQPGAHLVALGLKGLPAGIYFVNIDGAGATNATPLTIVR